MTAAQTSPVDVFTLKEVRSRLFSVADAPDLRFWSYSATEMDRGLIYNSIKTLAGITNTYDIPE